MVCWRGIRDTSLNDFSEYDSWLRLLSSIIKELDSPVDSEIDTRDYLYPDKNYNNQILYKLY